MVFTDTHTHMYLEHFEEDRVEIMKKALDAGVERMFLPNIDSGYFDAMMKLVSNYPHHCFPMSGLHPCSVKENYKEELAFVKAQLDSETNFYAVGEIGIDLHWDQSTLGIQQEAFEQQIVWAKERNLPIVIHARESYYEIFDIVEKHLDGNLRGIFHCFSAGEAQAKKILSYETFLMGIGGVVTFKNSKLAEVLKTVPIEKLVLETDAPYLTPHPYRGQRNDASNLVLVAEKLATIYGCTLEEVANITTQNSKNMFGI